MTSRRDALRQRVQRPGIKRQPETPDRSPIGWKSGGSLNVAFCVAATVVFHCTFVPHMHYQLSKRCSRHIFSHVLTPLTNCLAEYEQRTLYGALVVILAMLFCPINCRFIINVIIIIIIITIIIIVIIKWLRLCCHHNFHQCAQAKSAASWSYLQRITGGGGLLVTHYTNRHIDSWRVVRHWLLFSLPINPNFVEHYLAMCLRIWVRQAAIPLRAGAAASAV